MNWFVMMTRKMVPFKVLLIVSLLLAAHLINGQDAKMTASLVPPLGYSKEKMMVNYLRLMKCLMKVEERKMFNPFILRKRGKEGKGRKDC